MSSFLRYGPPGAVAVVLVVALAGPAPAQTPISWTGSASGSWFTAANWNPAVVPTSFTGSYAVTIAPPAGVNVTLDTSYTYVDIDSLNLSATSATLTIGSSPGINSSLTIINAYGGNLTVGAGNNILLGAGTGGESGSLLFRGNVSLQGGGTITLNDQYSNITAGTNSFTVTNGLTIHGFGYIGTTNGSNANGVFQLVNQPSGLISADNPNRGGIYLATSGASTNAGTLQASNGNNLTINTTTGSLTNTGTISALDGSEVDLANGTIRGGVNGQFTTTGSGVIWVDSSCILDGTNAPIAISGSMRLDGSPTIQGTLTNNGTISFHGGGLRLGGNTTLNGTGTLTLSGSSITASAAGTTLTNASTINGLGSFGGNQDVFINQSTGSVNANTSGRTFNLNVGGASSNAGTLEASNGGTLAITCPYLQGTATASLTNTGAIMALNGSTVTLNYAGGFGPSPFSIVGGPGNQFATAGTGLIQGSNVLLDGSASPVVNAGTFQDALLVQLKGTLTNNGTFTVLAGKFLPLVGDATLNGSGTLTLTIDSLGNTARMPAFSGNRTLTNASTINGAGIIGGDPNGNGFGNLAVVNQSTGLIDANVSGQSLIVQANPSLTNAGTLHAGNGGTLSLIGGGTLTNTGTIRAEGGAYATLLAVTLTNLSGNTLTGGSYQAAGTGSTILLANNANVTTLNASVTLDGGGAVTDQNGLDAFRNLSAVGNGGSFSLLNGHNQTLAGPFTNAGTVQVSNATTLTTLAGYTQTGGLTQLTDSGSTLTAATAAFNGGTLKGNGVVNASVSFNGGTLSPGDSPGMLTVNGTLGMGSGSTFLAEVGGVTQGTQYDFLSNNGVATLGGALHVLLVGGFTPTNSETFTILADTGALAGSFANVVNGGTLMTSDGLGTFTVNYGPGSSFGSDNLVLSNFIPVPEPGTLVLVGAAVGGWAAVRRFRKLTGRRVAFSAGHENRDACSGSVEIAKSSASILTPIASYPTAQAAATVEPEPRNGSRTMPSPSGNRLRTTIRKTIGH